jgi:hypothetical protein
MNSVIRVSEDRLTPKYMDREKVRMALRGEDIHTNLLDPAIKHTHSTFYYIVLYCVVSGILLFIVQRTCLGSQGSHTRYALKHYLRKLRGKTTSSNQ